MMKRLFWLAIFAGAVGLLVLTWQQSRRCEERGGQWNVLQKLCVGALRP